MDDNELTKTANSKNPGWDDKSAIFGSENPDAPANVLKPLPPPAPPEIVKVVPPPSKDE